MTTLIEFLEARIAEDEADEFGEVTPRHLDDCDHLSPPPGPFPCNCSGPARVLAECAAKRRIIAFHRSWPVLVEAPPTFEQSDGEGYDFASGDISSMTLRMSQRIAWLTSQEYVKRFGTDPPTAPMLLALAAPYADHPDFDSAWAA